MGSESITPPSVRDWSKMVTFEPRLYFKPKNMEELEGALASLISGALKPNRIRVLGSMHSCSRIHAADAVVDTSALEKIFQPDEDHNKVTVSANWQLRAFLAEST